MLHRDFRMNSKARTLAEYRWQVDNTVRKLTGLPIIPHPPEPISYGPETKDKCRWVENVERQISFSGGLVSGLRVVGFVDEIRQTDDREDDYFTHPLIDHQGWYLDMDIQDKVARGVVLRLPARDRKPMYVPAVKDPYNDGCYLAYFRDCTNSLREAIHDAEEQEEQGAGTGEAEYVA